MVSTEGESWLIVYNKISPYCRQFGGWGQVRVGARYTCTNRLSGYLGSI